MKALEQILNYTTLLKFVEAIKDGIPNPLPKAFFSTTEKTNGDVALLHRVYGQRQLAKMVQYGAAAVEQTMKKLDSFPIKLLHANNSITFDPKILMQLRSLNSYDLDAGKQYVAMQMKHFVTSFMNLRIASVTSLMVNGKIWMDTNGNMLPTSSGADTARTVDAGVPANNQGSLNSIISASWATSSTNIPLHLRNVRIQSLRDTGYEVKNILYGKKVPGYLTQNDYVKDFLSRTGSHPGSNMSQEYLDSGDIPQGLFGFNWIPIYTSFFEDQSGTNQSAAEPYSGDEIIFFPDVSSDWWSLVEGSYPVPTDINLKTDAEAGLASLTFPHGMAAYANVTFNPPAIRMFHVDTWMPFLKNPSVVYQGDAVP